MDTAEGSSALVGSEVVVMALPAESAESGSNSDGARPPRKVHFDNSLQDSTEFLVDDECRMDRVVKGSGATNVRKSRTETTDGPVPHLKLADVEKSALDGAMAVQRALQLRFDLTKERVNASFLLWHPDRVEVALPDFRRRQSLWYLGAFSSWKTISRQDAEATYLGHGQPHFHFGETPESKHFSLPKCGHDKWESNEFGHCRLHPKLRVALCTPMRFKGSPQRGSLHTADLSELDDEEVVSDF